MYDLNKYFVYNKNLDSDPRHLVICFYHAGGNAAAYKKWVDKSESVVFAPVELSGRGMRNQEKSLVSFDNLVEELVPVIEQAVRGRSYSFFGHSMGAAIAFKVEHFLEKRYGFVAENIFVAGRHGPNIEDPGTFRISMGDAALIHELKSMSKENSFIYDNQEFLDFFLPIIRDDYILHEDFAYRDEVIKAPITAHAGSDDYPAGAGFMEEWAKVTEGGFNIREFIGGHFFVHELGDFYMRELEEEAGDSDCRRGVI